MSADMHNRTADSRRTLRTTTPGRSCLTCRRRKIRCDRGQPCGYCTRLDALCTYPDSELSEKSSPEAALLTRVKRIEASLGRLKARRPHANHQESAASLLEPSAPAEDNQVTNSDAAFSPASGKLVVEEEKARFVNGSFWVDLEAEEVEQSPYQEELSQRTTGVSSTHQVSYRHDPAFVLGFFPATDGLRNLHPPPEQIFTTWQLFIENVDPLLKVIHVPTTQRQILRASSHLDTVHPAFESLMFAIYYAAVSSVECTVACKKLLHEERAELLDRYRFGVEQSLARANFMSNPELFSLQALTLYLICARHRAERTLVWTLTGTAIRLATRLGLHQDPATLHLSPFVSEMRRRLWWQVLILDVLTAEENDMDPSIYEHNYDTKFPANISDQALDLNMTGPVRGDTRRTEMQFALQRCEISYKARKVLFSDKFAHDNGYKKLSTDAKNDFLDCLYQTLDTKYIDHCDNNIPICFMTKTASRLVLAKMKLTIYHPARTGSSAMLKSSLSDLMRSSIDIIEDIQTLRAHAKYQRWVWLFQRYVEWDAVALLLRSLSVCCHAELADRAWQLVDTFFAAWMGRVPDGSIIKRWQRLQLLKAKAEIKRGGNRATTSQISTDSIQAFSQLPGRSASIPTCDAAFGTREGLNGYPAPDGPRQPPEVQFRDFGQKIFGSSSEPALLEGAAASGVAVDSLTHTEDSHSTNSDTWTFDNVSYAVDNGPSWVMDIDDHHFDSWF